MWSMRGTVLRLPIAFSFCNVLAATLLFKQMVQHKLSLRGGGETDEIEADGLAALSPKIHALNRPHANTRPYLQRICRSVARRYSAKQRV